jgi:hypothetical protein
MHSLNILFVKNCHNELKFKTISFVLFYIELTLITIKKSDMGKLGNKHLEKLVKFVIIGKNIKLM